LSRIVPAGIELHSLPAEAQRVAPQLRGFGYIVVEEQIALVDQRSHKVELVFPRWGKLRGEPPFGTSLRLTLRLYAHLRR
jgi:hypothetical protein